MSVKKTAKASKKSAVKAPASKVKLPRSTPPKSAAVKAKKSVVETAGEGIMRVIKKESKKVLSRPKAAVAPVTSKPSFDEAVSTRKATKSGMMVDMLLAQEHTDDEIYEAVSKEFGTFDRSQISINRCDLNDMVHNKYAAKKAAAGFTGGMPQYVYDEAGQLVAKVRKSSN